MEDNAGGATGGNKEKADCGINKDNPAEAKPEKNDTSGNTAKPDTKPDTKEIPSSSEKKSDIKAEVKPLLFFPVVPSSTDVEEVFRTCWNIYKVCWKSFYAYQLAVVGIAVVLSLPIVVTLILLMTLLPNYSRNACFVFLIISSISAAISLVIALLSSVFPFGPAHMVRYILAGKKIQWKTGFSEIFSNTGLHLKAGIVFALGTALISLLPFGGILAAVLFPYLYAVKTARPDIALIDAFKESFRFSVRNRGWAPSLVIYAIMTGLSGGLGLFAGVAFGIIPLIASALMYSTHNRAFEIIIGVCMIATLLLIFIVVIGIVLAFVNFKDIVYSYAYYRYGDIFLPHTEYGLNLMPADPTAFFGNMKE